MANFSKFYVCGKNPEIFLLFKINEWWLAMSYDISLAPFSLQNAKQFAFCLTLELWLNQNNKNKKSYKK